MSSGNENSAEHIKQKIELKKENLKFLNSFYLPVLSGLALMVVKANTVTSGDSAEYFMLGLIFLGFITIKKKMVRKEIELLISNCKKGLWKIFLS
jgi:hypothetical protein